MSWRRCLKGFRGLVAVLLFVGSLDVVDPRPAKAGVTTVADAGGDVRGGQLTVRERVAIDISSVTVIGEEGLGLLATVTFGGNIERALGRRHLENGAVAIILRPEANPAASGGGLVAQGSSFSQRLLRSTASSEVGAVRDERTLTFLISGAGFSNVGAVEVKTFARPPGGKRASGRTRNAQTAAVPFDRFAAGTGADGLLADTDPAPLNCDELELGRGQLLDMLEDLVKQEAELEKAIEELDKNIKASKKSTQKILDNSWKYSQEFIDHLLETLREKILRRRALREALDLLRKTKEAVRDLLTALETSKASRCGLDAVFDWDFQGEVEVRGTGTFTGSAGRAAATRGESNADIDAVKVVIPPDGSNPRQITSQICPSQLPTASVSTTTYTNDTLTCNGGTLAIGEQFTLNVRTSPPPTAGMGGQLYGRQDGAFQGPFAITGP